MYQSIERSFNKIAPLAEIVEVSKNMKSQEYYFQLLGDYGISLNEAQEEAVAAVDGPVLVVAGAGSGKTTVLTARVGYMIHEKQIDPASILLVTFTKKASTEMIERLSTIPGMSRQAAREVNAGTFHAICLKILRNEGYDFNILSSERKQHFIIKSILKRQDLQDSYSPEAVLMYISGWKNALVTPNQVMPVNEVEIELQSIYKQYETYKSEQNLFDFDDILLEAYYLLKFDQAALAKYQEQYEYILCDEFQDTSSVQYEIILMLTKPHNNLCIVGDDDQTIYSFRSAANVVGIGNTLIKNNEVRIKKQLKSVSDESFEVMYHQPRTSDEEATEIIADIVRKVGAGISLADIAVIYRTHATGRAIFDKLLEADIPFVTYSQKNVSFYETTFVKPILSILKAVSDSSNAEAIIEAAPVFYISKSDMQRALEYVSGEGEPLSFKHFKKALYHIAGQKTGYFKQSLLRKADSLMSLRSLKPAAAIHAIRKGEIDYEHQLEVDGRKTLSLHKEMVIESLDEIEQSARSSKDINDFLSLVERVIEKNKEMEKLRKIPDIEAVKLMTIHTSKGLEFEVVYAIGWSEGILPHASAIKNTKKIEDSKLNNEQLLEEERRLGYVAVTRTKRFLHLSSPQYHRGHKVEISRFIENAMDLPIASGKKEAVNA